MTDPQTLFWQIVLTTWTWWEIEAQEQYAQDVEASVSW